MSRPMTPIFPKAKLTTAEPESTIKTPPSFAKRKWAKDPSPPPSDSNLFKAVCSQLSSFLSSDSFSNDEMIQAKISNIYEEIKTIRNCFEGKSQKSENKEISKMSMENEDLRACILRLIMRGNDDFNHDLFQFDKYSDYGISLFKAEVEKTIQKWINISIDVYSDIELEMALRKCYEKIIRCSQPDSRILYTNSDDDTLNRIDSDKLCMRCNQLQADLDYLEMLKISDIEDNQEKLKQKDNEINNLKNEIEDYKKFYDPKVENICYHHLLKIRADVENLLDCDLPQIDRDLQSQVPELWVQIRKVVGETAKKARARVRSSTKSETELIVCRIDDIKSSINQLEEIIDLISEGGTEKAYKLNIANFQVSIKVKKPSEIWDCPNVDLDFCNSTIPLPKANESIPQSVFYYQTEFNTEGEFDSFCEEYSLQMMDRSRLESENIERLAEQMSKEAEFAKMKLSFDQSGLSFEGPLMTEMQESIKSYKEKEELTRHENEFLIANQKILDENLKKCNGEIQELKNENQELRTAIKSLQKLFTSSSDSSEEQKPSGSTTKDLEILKLLEELREKEHEISTCTDKHQVHQLCRSINSIKTKISKLKTEKAIESSALATAKLNKSLYIIEKEWIHKEEKLRIKSRLSRNPKQSCASSYFLTSPSSSFCSTPSRSISPVCETSRKFSFVSIGSVSRQRSQTVRSSEELEYLRREFDNCMVEKSILEFELKRVKDESKFDEKMNEIKAKEEAASKLIEERQYQEKMIHEKWIEIHRRENEVEMQKEEVYELKGKLLTKEEELKNLESKLKNKEDRLQRKEKEWEVKAIKEMKNHSYGKSNKNMEQAMEENRILKKKLYDFKKEKEITNAKIASIEKDLAQFSKKKYQICEIENQLNSISHKFGI